MKRTGKKLNFTLWILFALLFLILLQMVSSLVLIQAQSQEGEEEMESLEMIRDPSVSLRCRRLLSTREEKLRLKQKTNSLVRRGEKLEKILPKEKKSIKRKLYFILNQLRQEQKIIEFNLSNLEEDIVRKGCPGISL